MKIMVIHLNNINLCPPAINLVENLVEHGHEVMLVSHNISDMKSIYANKEKLKRFDLGEYAIIPPDLLDQVCSSRIIIADEKQCFSDSICDCIEKLFENHRINRNGDAVWNNP